MTEPDPGLQLPVGDTLVMTMIVVDHPVDTALDVTPTVTEARLAVVATTRTIAVDIGLLPELVVRLMITLLPGADSRILTAVTTPLTHTSMAAPHMIVPHQETTLQETLLMITRDHARATGTSTPWCAWVLLKLRRSKTA